MGLSVIEMKGQKYGRLMVIKRAENNKYGDAMWECRCECGAVIVTAGYRIRSGKAKSCGCYHKDKMADRCFRHGYADTKLYRAWAAMRARCFNETNESYPRYGGRGIAVCSVWEDFITFREWALKNGYRPGLTIERIDVNGNYEPSNCCFATRREQNRNTTRNVRVNLDGKEYLLADLARMAGVTRGTMSARYSRGLRGRDLLAGCR